MLEVHDTTHGKIRPLQHSRGTLRDFFGGIGIPGAPGWKLAMEESTEVICLFVNFSILNVFEIVLKSSDLSAFELL